MSEGIRSGVNWTRLKRESRASSECRDQHRLRQAGHAHEQAVRRSRGMDTSRSSITSRWPTMTFATSAAMRSWAPASVRGRSGRRFCPQGSRKSPSADLESWASGAAHFHPGDVTGFSAAAGPHRGARKPRPEASQVAEEATLGQPALPVQDMSGSAATGRRRRLFTYCSGALPAVPGRAPSSRATRRTRRAQLRAAGVRTAFRDDPVKTAHRSGEQRSRPSRPSRPSGRRAVQHEVQLPRTPDAATLRRSTIE